MPRIAVYTIRDDGKWSLLVGRFPRGDYQRVREVREAIRKILARPLSPRARGRGEGADPARGMVKVHAGVVWVRVSDGPWKNAKAHEPLVGRDRSPPEPTMDARDIRAAIRYAVSRALSRPRSSEGGR